MFAGARDAETGFGQARGARQKIAAKAQTAPLFGARRLQSAIVCPAPEAASQIAAAAARVKPAGTGSVAKALLSAQQPSLEGASRKWKSMTPTRPTTEVRQASPGSAISGC